MTSKLNNKGVYVQKETDESFSEKQKVVKWWHPDTY